MTPTPQADPLQEIAALKELLREKAVEIERLRKSTQLMEEIERWSKEYEFSFQFWGPGENNVYISKGDIDLHDFGGEETVEDAMRKAMEWVNKQNPSGRMVSEQKGHRCIGCGCRIAPGNDLCGECACEDDGYI